MFMPPYSCAFNPIERLWAFIKTKWRRHLTEVKGVSNFTIETVEALDGIVKMLEDLKVK